MFWDSLWIPSRPKLKMFPPVNWTVHLTPGTLKKPSVIPLAFQVPENSSQAAVPARVSANVIEAPVFAESIIAAGPKNISRLPSCASEVSITTFRPLPMMSVWSTQRPPKAPPNAQTDLRSFDFSLCEHKIRLGLAPQAAIYHHSIILRADIKIAVGNHVNRIKPNTVPEILGAVLTIDHNLIYHRSTEVFQVHGSAASHSREGGDAKPADMPIHHILNCQNIDVRIGSCIGKNGLVGTVTGNRNARCCRLQGGVDHIYSSRRVSASARGECAEPLSHGICIIRLSIPDRPEIAKVQNGVCDLRE